jgi:TetR/AcrR family transcriptional repressor of nem operon
MNTTAQQIIEKGIELFSKKGYGNVGLNEILTAANIPKGSFYYYFKSKEDFGLQVIDAYSKSTLVYLNNTLLNSKRTSKERLLAFFTAMAKTYSNKGFTEGCLLGNSSLELGDISVQFAAKTSGELNKWQKVFEQCIKEGQNEGSIKNKIDPAILANFILNSWEGTMVRMKSDKSDISFKSFVSIMTELL